MVTFNNLIKAAVVAAFFLWSPIGYAFSLSAGYETQNVDYSEFDSRGRFLDSDKGIIDGFFIKSNVQISGLFFESSITRLSGSLDYDSINARSTTEVESVSVYAKAGKVLSINRFEYKAGPVLRYRRYQRDIASTPELFGLNELYTYSSIGVFLSARYEFSESLDLEMFTSQTYTYDSNLEVEFLSEQFDEIRFELGKSRSSVFGLGASMILTPSMSITTRLVYARDRTEASAAFPLYQNTIRTSNVVSEPYSEKESISLSIGLKWFPSSF